MPDRADLPHVVILGAGFGGLAAVRALSKKPVRVTIVDRNNFHGFQPLYYQVATAGLEPEEVAHNVRDIVRRAPNVDVRMGEVVGVDLAARTLAFADGPDLAFDFLIVAAGAETAYFGVSGAKELGFPLKSLQDGIRLRNHVLSLFEDYNVYGDALSTGTLTFVVVGGGATGVETAGALVELYRISLARDFKRFDTRRAAHVILVERGPGLLAGYPDDLRAYAKEKLQRRQVEVRVNTAVKAVTERGVELENGETIPSKTVVWAVGVEASPVATLLGAETGKGGRVKVRPDLSLPSEPNVYVIGDMAEVEGQERLPQLAQVAMQGGKHAAKTILRSLQGQPPEPFAYTDLGSMATIGRNAAVAMLFGKIPLKGLLAWLAWVFVHLMQLVGFRNRVNVFVNWVSNYFTYDRAARLILGSGRADDGPRFRDDGDRRRAES